MADGRWQMITASCFDASRFGSITEVRCICYLMRGTPYQMQPVRPVESLSKSISVLSVSQNPFLESLSTSWRFAWPKDSYVHEADAYQRLVELEALC
jgi:hypothetical protein